MIKLNDILYEINRFKKETGRTLPRWKDLLNDYAGEVEHYVHFSSVPRVGLYLVNKYETPIGFYAYPLIFEKMSDFAVDRPYAIVFTVKPAGKILNLRRYPTQNFSKDIEILKNKYEFTDKQLDDWSLRSRKKSFSGQLWNITRNISLLSDEKKNFKKGVTAGGTTAKWTMILNKDLGYDGVIDNGMGIIHPSEPHQAVFFNTSVIDIVDIVNTPKDKVKKIDDYINDNTVYINENLKDKDFSYKNLNNSVFLKCDLSNARFAYSLLNNSNFRKSNLDGVRFNGAILKNVNFSEANLENVSFEYMNLDKCNFSKAKLNSETSFF